MRHVVAQFPVMMPCQSVLLARMQEPCADASWGPLTAMDIAPLAECVQAVSIKKNIYG